MTNDDDSPDQSAEHIRHEEGAPDAWVCRCGNMAHTDGFAPCNPMGVEIEPTLGSGWADLFVCRRCDRIIDQNSLAVVGRAGSS